MINKIYSVKEKKELLPVAGIFIIFLLLCVMYWKVDYLLMVDSGREILIPSAILKKQILYRDIFNLYGPLAYYLNAFILGVFGVKLNTLYAAGAVCSLVLIYSVYGIAREFTGRLTSFLLVEAAMTLCMITGNLHNFLFPYTFAVTYSISAYALAALFLIKYTKTGTAKFAVLASLFCGFSVACKNDFWLLPPILLFTVISVKPLNKTNMLKCAGAFLIFPLLSLSALLLQGWRPSDFVNTCAFMKKFLTGQSFIQASVTYGMYPNPAAFLPSVVSFLKMASISLICYLIFKIPNNFLKYFCFFCAVLLLAAFVNFSVRDSQFCYLPVLMLFLLIIDFKKIYTDKPLFLLMLLALGTTPRTFFGFSVMWGYGIYTFPVLFTAFVIYISNRTGLKKFFVFWLAMLACVYSLFNAANRIIFKTDRVAGNNDCIYTATNYAIPLNSFIKYINENTRKTDKILFYPEGSMLSYLSGRPADCNYYMLHEHFTEAAGIENVISHIRAEKTEYIAFVQGFETPIFQKNMVHRLQFFEFVKNDYELIQSFERGKNRIDLYKLK
ncbi:MAG: glycosyltransferase family 39 protein [Heliobacteriaceae bacterium]|jgi:hypothetical protein|nr:glycosyltransferase family 39 protein [Heliobacteriaceae bacterium]